jgi:hypothetical protein
MATTFGVLFLVAGAAVALVGLAQLDRTRLVDVDDAGDYLRSLDLEDENTDEFERLLAQPVIG